MTELTVTRTGIDAGVWRGRVTGTDGRKPEIEVLHLAEPLTDVRLSPDAGDGAWRLEIPIPASALNEGMQTFMIRDATTGERLESFALIAGTPLDDDIRAEIDLLRAELELLKTAVRHQHAPKGPDPTG